MPLKNGHLTRQESRFADALGRTGDTAYAAHEAGYKGHAEAARVAKRPAVQERSMDVRRAATMMFNDEVFPLAVETIKALLGSANEKTRLGAVSEVFKGYKTLNVVESLAEKEIHDMTPEELHAYIRENERREAERARTIEHDPEEGQAVEVEPAPAVPSLLDELG